MKKNKKQRRVLMLLLILLGVTVGFALLSVTLKINGTAGIKKNTWDIHWENVQPNNESTVTANIPEIDTNKTKVSYEVTLELPGDFYEFTVDAKNDGSINGEITKIDHNVYQVVNGVAETETTTLPSYINYSIVYDGTEDAPAEGDILESGAKKTYRIRIEYNSEATTLPETDLTYKIDDEIDYEQTNDSEEVTGFLAPKPDNGPTLGGLRYGDEVCIGNETIGKECFNVITSDDNETKMLAKYNLKVGYNCTGNTDDKCTEISTTTEGYGKQSQSEAGTMEFSNSCYWYGKVGEGSEYTYQGKIEYSNTLNGGPANSYLEDYYNDINYGLPYVFDSNSQIYPYVQNYVIYLKTIGAPNNTTGQLLTTDYFAKGPIYCLFGHSCDEDENEFIVNTNFWLGNAAEACMSNGEICNSSSYFSAYCEVYGIDSDSGYSYTGYNQRSIGGIRPLITISTSSIVFDGWRFVNPGSTGTNQKYEYWTKGKRIEEGLIPNLPDYSNNPQTYYFKNGYVQYGWQKINDKVYYFRDTDTDQEGSAGYGYTDGNMVYGGTINIGGTDYEFASSGECISNNCPSL